MNWMQLLSQLFELVIIPLLGIGTLYLISLIKTKINELKMKQDNETLSKYLDMLDKTITEAVIATNQVYVDTLKEEGAFNLEAQKAAFQKTYNAVIQILTDDAKEFLEISMGDLELYIRNKIESEVNYWSGK